MVITQIIVDQEKINPIEICSICRKCVYSKKDLFICPFCTSPFHRSHLENWLEINNSCPVCISSFKSFNLWNKTNTNYYAISSSRKRNSDHLRPDIHTRSSVRNEVRNSRRMNTEEKKEVKITNLIGAFTVFLIIINQINGTLAFLGSVIIFPMFLALFIKWAISYLRGWIR